MRRALWSRRLALKQSSSLALILSCGHVLVEFPYVWSNGCLWLRPNSAIRKCCRWELKSSNQPHTSCTSCSSCTPLCLFHLLQCMVFCFLSCSGVQLIKNGKKIAAFVPRLVVTMQRAASHCVECVLNELKQWIEFFPGVEEWLFSSVGAVGGLNKYRFTRHIDARLTWQSVSLVKNSPPPQIHVAQAEKDTH